MWYPATVALGYMDSCILKVKINVINVHLDAQFVKTTLQIVLNACQVSSWIKHQSNVSLVLLVTVIIVQPKESVLNANKIWYYSKIFAITHNITVLLIVKVASLEIPIIVPLVQWSTTASHRINKIRNVLNVISKHAWCVPQKILLSVGNA